MLKDYCEDCKQVTTWKLARVGLEPEHRCTGCAFAIIWME